MDKKLIITIGVFAPLAVIACKMLKGETKSNLAGRAWTIKDRAKGEKGDIIPVYR